MDHILNMSCGEALLKSAFRTSDYVLYLTDGKEEEYCKILTHRCVLSSHSNVLHDLVYNGENYYDLVFELEPRHLSPMIELLQFMYLHDYNLITYKDEVKELMVKLGMPVYYYSFPVLNNTPVDTYIQISLQPDERHIVVSKDMMSRIDWLKRKVISSLCKKTYDIMTETSSQETSVSSVPPIATRLRSRKKKKYV